MRRGGDGVRSVRGGEARQRAASGRRSPGARRGRRGCSSRARGSWRPPSAGRCRRARLPDDVALVAERPSRAGRCTTGVDQVVQLVLPRHRLVRSFESVGISSKRYLRFGAAESVGGGMGEGARRRGAGAGGGRRQRGRAAAAHVKASDLAPVTLPFVLLDAAEDGVDVDRAVARVGEERLVGAALVGDDLVDLVVGEVEDEVAGQPRRRARHAAADAVEGLERVAEDEAARRARVVGVGEVLAEVDPHLGAHLLVAGDRVAAVVLDVEVERDARAVAVAPVVRGVEALGHYQVEAADLGEHRRREDVAARRLRGEVSCCAGTSRRRRRSGHVVDRLRLLRHPQLVLLDHRRHREARRDQPH